MKSTQIKYLGLCLLACAVFFGVQPLHAITPDTTQYTNLIIRINSYVGNEKLELNGPAYQSPSGQTFTVSTFNYFISNIVLNKANGEKYVVPQEESYFLLKQSDPESGTIALRVPAGTYTGLGFVLGVDSLRSIMDISRRKGVLDPAGGMIAGMYWSWNTGYIFMKLEGESASAPLDKTGKPKFRFHIGGFGGYNKPSLNNIRNIVIPLPEAIVLKRPGATAGISLKADILKVIDGQTTFDFGKNPSIMFGQISALMAQNYTGMFTLVSAGGNE